MKLRARSAGLRQQASDHALGLCRVAAAEQIEVVEHVIQVVEVLAHRVTRVERPGFLVGGVEGGRVSAELLGHRQIHLAVAIVDGRVEQDRFLLDIAVVAPPQIAVQQRGQRVVAGKKCAQPLQQTVSLPQ